MNAKRTHNVQTPGHAPSADEDQANEQKTPAPETSQAAEGGPNVQDQTDKPNAGRRATKATDKPESRPYRDMRADEIDVTKLTAPVLCKEGWLVPAPKPDAPSKLGGL